MDVLFNHAEDTAEEDLEKIIGSDQIMERAYDELNRFSWNEEELLTYDQAEKYESTYIASMAQKYDEGIAKGREEGEQIGVKKVAINFLKSGVNKEVISKNTGLSIDEINKLA